MITCRLLRPGSKLCFERELGPARTTAPAALLDLRHPSAHELYRAKDWLAQRQTAIERKPGNRHIGDGSLALVDVSSYLEGTCCELASRGYSRDHRADRP